MPINIDNDITCDKEKEEIHFAENNPINKTKSKAKVKKRRLF